MFASGVGCSSFACSTSEGASTGVESGGGGTGNASDVPAAPTDALGGSGSDGGSAGAGPAASTEPAGSPSSMGPEPVGSAGASSVGPDVSPTVVAPTYFKASNPEAGDEFGAAVALSADGNTLAVGANGKTSAAQGAGDPGAEPRSEAGAVYVFTRSGDSWQQQAYLESSHPVAGGRFGTAVALSADGNTLAVGAPTSRSAALPLLDEPGDPSSGAAAVYVFVRNGDTWEQQAAVRAANTVDDDGFGLALALSADGNTLVVGAEEEDSAATGIHSGADVNGSADEGSAEGSANQGFARDSGAVYLFSRAGGVWQQEAYLKASNTGVGDRFGGAVALSAEGDTVAVGAYWEDSGSTGIDADQTDETLQDSGAVYVFARSDGSWSQQAYVKPSVFGGLGFDSFGCAVSLSAAGDVLVVGAAGEASSARGIDGDPRDTSMPYAGAAYVFVRSGAAWAQSAYVKASNTFEGDEFGHHLHLSADGTTLVVGAAMESGASGGFDGNAGTRSSPRSGAAYVFRVVDGTWAQSAYVKASNPAVNARFGWSVALSAAGVELAVGAIGETGSSSGIDGDQTQRASLATGAVYLYEGHSAPSSAAME